MLREAIPCGTSLYEPKSPRHAARRGIVLVTEDRKKDGFIPQLDAKLNVALPVLKDFVTFEWLRRGLIRLDTSIVLQHVQIRGNLDGPMARLSGGNQQKVLFARAIRQKPKLFLLDEPTKGVDIGAKNEIHRIIRRLAEENHKVLVLVVSSEEEEILGIADDAPSGTPPLWCTCRYGCRLPLCDRPRPSSLLLVPQS